MSRGHHHDPMSSTQNQGNSLGSRSCVRQSKLFRQYESGNSIKSILGTPNLCWQTNTKEGAYAGQRVFDHEKSVQFIGLRQHEHEIPPKNNVKMEFHDRETAGTYSERVDLSQFSIPKSSESHTLRELDEKLFFEGTHSNYSSHIITSKNTPTGVAVSHQCILTTRPWWNGNNGSSQIVFPPSIIWRKCRSSDAEIVSFKYCYFCVLFEYYAY